MDDFVLTSSWNKSDVSQLPVYIAVEGLYIQGCTFDGMRLSEATPDDPSVSSVPVCYLAWTPKVRYYSNLHLA
jgi:hypothetical protein